MGPTLPTSATKALDWKSTRNLYPTCWGRNCIQSRDSACSTMFLQHMTFPCTRPHLVSLARWWKAHTPIFTHTPRLSLFINIIYGRAPLSLVPPLYYTLFFQKIKRSITSISVEILLKLSFGIRELDVPKLHNGTHHTLAALALLYEPPFSGYLNSDSVQVLSFSPTVTVALSPQRM